MKQVRLSPPAQDVRLTRRQLLRAGLCAGGLSAFAASAPRWLLPRVQAAPPPRDRYFLFCYFSGGWDLLLSLDPRDPHAFSPDLKKITRIDPGFHLLGSSRRSLVQTSVPGMEFGPYIGKLADHAQELCIVRGMSMDTLTPEVGRRRFITGIQPAGLQARGSSIATILAAHLGQEDPIPQLSVRVESYNDAWPSFSSAVKVNSVSDLQRALQPAPDALGSEEQASIDSLLQEFRDCDPAASSAFMQRAHDERAASQALVALGLSPRFNFSSQTPEMEAVRALYGFEADDLKSPGAQAAAAVTALTSGVTRCASIIATQNLDTHGPEWSGSHGPRLESGFNIMAAILQDLASREYKDTGDRWLDHVTVVGFSEFGRSTLLNSSEGRDHFLHNACVLAGAGVARGSIVGASSDVGMNPQATDLSSGRTDPAGVVVKPEHIYRALLKDVGVEEDVADYRAEPLTAITAS